MSGRGAWIAALVLLGVAAGRAITAPTERVPDLSALARAQAPESAPAQSLGGAVVIGANDLGRLLGATKFWRADVRKLVLRVGTHRIQLTVDNPFALVDDGTVRLPAPVRSVRGELQVPVALVESLPRDSSIVRLLYDPLRREVFQVPPGGVVRAPRVVIEDDATRLVFPVDAPGEAWVATRSRAHFRVHFGGFFVGAIPDSFPDASLVRAMRRLPSVSGTAFDLELAPGTAGFRLIREPEADRVTLHVTTRARDDFEAFAPEGPPGPRPLRVVVLDPGHGGADAGVRVGGATEKDLALTLARALKVELERRLSVRVVLTRDDDRALTLDERAERANRARADLLLSLHFDGFAGPAARGATAWCPPATYATPTDVEGRSGAGGVAVLPWRDVATRHAVVSRELAEDILSALELRGQGPTRLREILPSSLLGVNAPGLMLECGTLTSEADRARMLGSGGIAALASGIADGIDAYRRGE